MAHFIQLSIFNGFAHPKAVKVSSRWISNDFTQKVTFGTDGIDNTALNIRKWLLTLFSLTCQRKSGTDHSRLCSGYKIKNTRRISGESPIPRGQGSTRSPANVFMPVDLKTTGLYPLHSHNESQKWTKRPNTLSCRIHFKNTKKILFSI